MSKLASLFGKVYAAPIVGPSTDITSIATVINRVLEILYGVVGVVLFGLLIYGGFLWLTSAGDPDKVRKSMDTMLNAVIGVAIVVFAYFATRVVSGVLGFPLL